MRYGGRNFFLTLILVFIILIIVYFFSLQNEHSRRPRISKNKRIKPRDFINHPVYDHETSFSKVAVTGTPQLQVFRTLKKMQYREDLCVKFNTLKGPTPICIFDPVIDTMISSYVKDYGTWEQELLNETGHILIQKPYLTFVDVGCNIGTFTLFTAKLGIRVIAIDILKSALELVEISLLKGGLQDNVTLVLNGISDTREHVSVHVVEENPGGSYTEHNISTNGNSVHTILLDDLLSLVRSGSVFLKLDIEGNEHKAFMGAKKFFQFLNVEHILMEWAFHRYSPNGKDIIQFLLRNGMLPFEKLTKHNPLDLTKSYQWPDNIFWSKR